MKVCDEGHDEVVFNGVICPVCEKMEEIENLEGDIVDLEKERDALIDEKDGDEDK
jgi:hypothetical protein